MPDPSWSFRVWEFLLRRFQNESSTFAASDGNEYEIQMGRWSRRLAEPFLDFTGTVDDEEVLDVGCGTGIWHPLSQNGRM
jgi:hypothetical protein